MIQNEFYTYFESRNEYSIEMVLFEIVLLFIAIYFRNEFFIAYSKFFGRKNELVLNFIHSGFVFILAFSIFIGVRGNYMIYLVNSGEYKEVEGVISGFSVEVNEKKMRVESFYVNKLFFLYMSPIEEKGLFGYGRGQSKCTPIGDGAPVKISYIVDGRRNVILLLKTTITDLCKR